MASLSLLAVQNVLSTTNGSVETATIERQNFESLTTFRRERGQERERRFQTFQ